MGYIEKAAPNQDFHERNYKDENGFLVDIEEWTKGPDERDIEWLNLAYRVVTSGLTEAEIDIIKVQTEALLEHFLRNKKK